MIQKVNVGLIGAGRIGRVHAENLAYRIPSANLAAVTDIIADSARQCAADYQIPSVAESPHSIFENDSIEAVIIIAIIRIQNRGLSRVDLIISVPETPD